MGELTLGYIIQIFTGLVFIFGTFAGIIIYFSKLNFKIKKIDNYLENDIKNHFKDSESCIKKLEIEDIKINESVGNLKEKIKEVKNDITNIKQEISNIKINSLSGKEK